MPVIIKRSASYAGQKVKIKQLGLGGFMKVFNFVVPPLSFVPGYRYAETCAVVRPNGDDRFSVFGGVDIPNDGPTVDGVLFNSDTGLWDTKILPLPTGELTARYGAASTATLDGNLMVIGGFYLGALTPIPPWISSGSVIYDLSTSTWSGETLLEDLPVNKGCFYLSTGKYADTDFANGRIFVYSPLAVQNETPGVEEALNTFHVWNGTTWQKIIPDPPIDPSTDENYYFLSQYNLGVRDDGSNSVVLLHTGSVATPGGNKIFRWNQTQTLPTIEGTWTDVTGSNGYIPNATDPMPVGPCGIMWEGGTRNRWVAVSTFPDLYGGLFGVNAWTSSNDGATWDAHVFGTGDFNSTDWYSGSGEGNLFPTLTPDPTRNRFYFSGNEAEGYAVWVINIADNPDDSTMVKVYTSPALPPPPSFVGRINAAFGVVKLLDNSYRIAVYGGNDGAGTLYNDGWLWESGTNTWTQMASTYSPVATGLSDCQGVGASQNFYIFGGHGETAADEFSGAFFYDTNNESWYNSYGSAGFTNAMAASVGNVFCSPNRLVAANNSLGLIYRYGGWDVDYSTIPRTYSWVNNFYYGDSSVGPGNEIHSDVELFGGPPPPQYVDPLVGSRDWTYWLTSRNLNLGGEDKKTMLMLFTGSWNNTFPQEYVQSIWRWEQTDVGVPNSGNWTFVTGSTGAAYSPDPMPIASVAIMWDENYYRWTAISADPGASPNIWTSTDDGATWTSYTYSNSWPHAGASPRADGIAEDPDNSRFYLYKFSSGFKLYELKVSATPGDSGLTEVFAE